MHFKLRRGVCEAEQRNVQIVHEQRGKHTTKSQLERRRVYPYFCSIALCVQWLYYEPNAVELMFV